MRIPLFSACAIGFLICLQIRQVIHLAGLQEKSLVFLHIRSETMRRVTNKLGLTLVRRGCVCFLKKFLRQKSTADWPVVYFHEAIENPLCRSRPKPE